MARLLQQSARPAAKFVILLGQDGLGRVDRRVKVPRRFLVVLGRARSANRLGEDLVQREFDVGVVCDVVIVGHHNFGQYFFYVLEDRNVIDFLDICNIFNVFEILFANYFFVKTLRELLFIEYFIRVAITCHIVPSL